MTRLIAAAIVIVLAAGCAKTHKPIDPDMIGPIDDIPPGPGIVTGRDGVLRWTPEKE